MSNPVDLVELWRGGMLESVHQGHAVVVDQSGDILHAWGDPEYITYPRSSAKMLQALPLVESGVADRFGLTTEQLALSCASHSGAAIHTDRVQNWLKDLELDDDAFCCGPQWPADKPASKELIKSDASACKYHNNCSGKHCGFLTMVKANGWGPDYVAMDHPLQVGIKQVVEELVEETSPNWGIDGCSAPNHASTVHGMARAMATFAKADDSSTRGSAMVRLRNAMMAHPDLVSNTDRACFHLMRAAKGKAAVKTGAEGFFIAILPEAKIGVALKIMDGTTRASECAMAAILCKLGVLDPNDPLVKQYRNPDLKNFAGLVTGDMRPSVALA
ncbi:asparaginase [Octadecabacter sp. 1_MG-2023]|uniref:asparaginase n=1 Tax=unclassified Octadecabacter TaxID=196158 RepID=UPI001C084763|nr:MULTISPECIES: asparaginase [unclassified Octadecabacter]MBU2992449.1 asparaginase [Octadecabacter sp. B2R22]MDO6734794.1 asparaginase [Octadecabacter sp. 1_MG-2023]